MDTPGPWQDTGPLRLDLFCLFKEEGTSKVGSLLPPVYWFIILLISTTHDPFFVLTHYLDPHRPSPIKPTPFSPFQRYFNRSCQLFPKPFFDRVLLESLLSRIVFLLVHISGTPSSLTSTNPSSVLSVHRPRPLTLVLHTNLSIRLRARWSSLGRPVRFVTSIIHIPHRWPPKFVSVLR